MPFPFSIIACVFSQPYPNTNIYGGAANPATTLSGCQNACTMNTSCQGIDWAPGNANGQQCFLLSTQNGKNSNVNGVTHYDYTCGGGTTTAYSLSLFKLFFMAFPILFGPTDAWAETWPWVLGVTKQVRAKTFEPNFRISFFRPTFLF